MTNWLDAAEVRGLKEISDYGIDTAAQRARDLGFGMSVLEAIAALPEPQRAYHDISHEHEGGMACCSEACTEWQLHRIWQVARIVCGKEEV